jgi:hypothetical protein
METETICVFVSQLASQFSGSQTLAADILPEKDFESRARVATSILVSTGLINSLAAEMTQNAMASFYRKLLIADGYKPTSHLDASTRVLLVKASNSFPHAKTLGDDYGLGNVCRGKVDIRVVNGTHDSFIQPAKDGSCAVSDIVDAALSV